MFPCVCWICCQTKWRPSDTAYFYVAHKLKLFFTLVTDFSIKIIIFHSMQRLQDPDFCVYKVLLEYSRLSGLNAVLGWLRHTGSRTDTVEVHETQSTHCQTFHKELTPPSMAYSNGCHRNRCEQHGSGATSHHWGRSGQMWHGS